VSFFAWLAAPGGSSVEITVELRSIVVVDLDGCYIHRQPCWRVHDQR